MELTARERYLAAQRKYNQSEKGKARYKRYDDAHPERKEARWEPARNNLHHREEISNDD